MELAAPAKINLHLSVLERREDGYHSLETLMVKLELADRLKLALTPGGLWLEVKGCDLPADKSNLIYRAAQRFFKTAGLNPGAAMTLVKNIPLAAGLGGGSSDAAAVLMGLNELTGRPLNRNRLFDIGLSLGADVPFFLQPWPAAWARGVGEKLNPFRGLDKLSLLVVNPGWPLSTAWVFKNFRIELTNGRQNHIFSGLHESSFTIDCGLHNDLESLVLARFPELTRIKELLLNSGALGALMTGSGPTIFGIFSDRADLKPVCRRLTEAGRGRWRIFQTSTLTNK